MPKGCKDKYQSDEAWGRYTILEFEPDGIRGVAGVDGKKESWYNLQGQRVDAPQRGVNVIRKQDGTVQKRVIR
ncbi:MAG: hypothetical protein ILA34_05655 [Bacteroidaceae bacterium]|nr:hypothetical protein [Bacteroidaceae bacterium]